MDLKLIKFFSILSLLSNIISCGKKIEIFTESFQYIWDEEPVKIRAGNFNKDNLLDVIISDRGGNLLILLNQGDGVFELINSKIGADYYLKDLNGDNIDDLVIMSDYLKVFIIDEMVNFKNSYNYQFPEYFFPVTVIFGYFNPDNIPDIAIGDYFGQLLVLIGKGDGTFDSRVYQTSFWFLQADDFNNDGIDEIVVSYGASIGVMQGIESGEFKTNLYDIGGFPCSMVIDDFNNNGIKDIAAAPRACVGPSFSYLVPVYNHQLKVEFLNSYRSTTDNDFLSVLIGNGDGTFRDPVNYSVGAYPIDLIIDDFNLDGFTDIAVLNFWSNDISILLGKEGGIFAPSTSYEVGDMPAKFVKGDFNGDGNTDIGIIYYSNEYYRHNWVQILLGKGDGTFKKEGNYEKGFMPVDIVSGDFNQDGLTDLVLTGYDSDGRGIVSVLIAKGE